MMKPDVCDAMSGGGLIMLGVGLWLISPSLALSVIGGLLFMLGLFLAGRRGW